MAWTMELNARTAYFTSCLQTLHSTNSAAGGISVRRSLLDAKMIKKKSGHGIRTMDLGLNALYINGIPPVSALTPMEIAYVGRKKESIKWSQD